MLSFDAEIENVKAFLALAEADSTRDIQIVNDLKETDFRIPQLSLEPVVENAVRHGTDEDGGTITISSFKEDNCYIIRTKDTGTGVRVPNLTTAVQLAKALGIIVPIVMTKKAITKVTDSFSLSRINERNAPINGATA